MGNSSLSVPSGGAMTPRLAKIFFTIAWLHMLISWWKYDDIILSLLHDWGILWFALHEWTLAFPIALIFTILIVIGQWITVRHERLMVIPEREKIARRFLLKIDRAIPMNERFFLYLRPHALEGKMITVNPQTTLERFPLWPGFSSQPSLVDLETLMSNALWKHAPVLAIGGSDPVLGAGKVKSSFEKWTGTFHALASKADVIVFVPANSTGCLWEIRSIVRECWTRKTMFIMPPSLNKTQRANWEAAKRTWIIEGVNLPKYRRSGLIFTISNDGEVMEKKKFSKYSMRNLENMARRIRGGDKKSAYQYYYTGRRRIMNRLRRLKRRCLRGRQEIVEGRR